MSPTLAAIMPLPGGSEELLSPQLG